MQSKPAPYANVFSAFSEGLSRKPEPQAPASAAPESSATTAPSSPFEYFRALATLADQPKATMPFTQFGGLLPGDSVGTLSAALRLMKEGLVEFVGDISEVSDIRLTASGRDLVETLRKATSA